MYAWKHTLSREIWSQCHIIWSLDIYLISWWCLRCIRHYESKNRWSSDDVWCCGHWHFVQFVHDRLHVCRRIYNWRLWRMLQYTAKIHGNFMGLGKIDYWCGLVIHITSLRWFFIKFKPKWISLPHAKSINSTILYDASTISSLANHTYSSIGISSLPQFIEEMRLVDSLATPFILCYSHSLHMAKSALQSVGKVLESSNSFVWFGDSSLSTLGNSMS